MKVIFKGRITEVGRNYTTDGLQHSGCIVACGSQNLHFELPEGTTADVAVHLFEEVTVTIATVPARTKKSTR